MDVGQDRCAVDKDVATLRANCLQHLPLSICRVSMVLHAVAVVEVAEVR